MKNQIEAYIDKLDYGIAHASVAISNYKKHSKWEAEFWIKEHDRLKKEKFLFLKRVFGS